MQHKTLFEQLAQWGHAATPELFQQTRALFSPLVAQPDERRVQRDVVYGPDARHRLDVFSPAVASGAPVLLFVHGGGFIMGDKGKAGEAFYNNVGAWAAAQGFVGVTMTYRLAPAHGWPAGRDDVCAAVNWLAAHVAQFGGSPRDIFILGQSAGAVHVADAVATGGRSIRGAMMISGIYDVQRAARDPFQKAYYGADEQRYAAASSLDALVASDIPCLFAVCEYDPPDFQQQAQWLVERWVQKHGHWPAMHWLRGHNHLSSVTQIGSDFDTLGPHVREFILGKGIQTEGVVATSN
jgi:triacylglycerol lipase